MPEETEKKIDRQVRLFFEGFADKNRMKILELLAEKELNVSSICENFSMKQPSVSHHLNVLKRAGVLDARKEGKEVFYSINKKNIAALMTYYLAKYGLAVREL